MSHRCLRALFGVVILLIGLTARVTAQEKPWTTGPFSCYEVPPMSSIMRLPKRIGDGAVLSKSVRIVAAKGEYEPGSFVIVPRQDIKKLELKATDLTSGSNKITASDIDIKIVKCWYQAGTAWYSYFGDSNRRELVPELLLKDETLVKVDMERKDNFLRVQGQYRWISYPKSEAKEAFNYLTTPVADSKTLQPIELTKGFNKQIWITVRVPKDAKAGIYRGKIRFRADGELAGAMDLQLRVLPFELPMPKTYYNLKNDYLVTIYGAGIMDMCYRLNMDQKTIDELQMKIYKNILAHNVFNCRSEMTLSNAGNRQLAIKKLSHELELMKKAGFVMKPLLSRGWSYPAPNRSEPTPDHPNYKKRIDDLAKTLKDAVGHSDIYVTSWDEAHGKRVDVIKQYAKYTLSKGLKLWITTNNQHFEKLGGMVGYANHGGWPNKARADKWHSVGSKVASYAGPHTGPENPDVFRRWEGMARYKEHYDGSYNYKLYSQLHPTLYKRYKSNVWNDFMGGAFRGFNITYPTTEGLIDTIAWEGYREGIDDVRYATKMMQLAAKAKKGSKEARKVSKQARDWLEALNAQASDLNAVRMEMIAYILKLQKAMGE